MRFIRRIALSLRSLLFRGRVERDLNREMDFHVEMEAAANERAGHSPSRGATPRHRSPSADANAFAKKRARSSADVSPRRCCRTCATPRACFGEAPRSHSPSCSRSRSGSAQRRSSSPSPITSCCGHCPIATPNRLVNVRGLSDQLATVTSTWPPNAGHYLAWQRDCTVCDGMIALRAGARTLTVEWRADSHRHASRLRQLLHAPWRARGARAAVRCRRRRAGQRTARHSQRRGVARTLFGAARHRGRCGDDRRRAVHGDRRAGAGLSRAAGQRPRRAGLDSQSRRRIHAARAERARANNRR